MADLFKSLLCSLSLAALVGTLDLVVLFPGMVRATLLGGQRSEWGPGFPFAWRWAASTS